MVWGSICLAARTELHVVAQGTLTAARYVEDILEQYVVPFAPFIGENFLYLHDNARPDTAQATQQYLQEVGIRLLPTPARNPDVNLMEHVWDMLGRRLRNREHAPGTLGELANALREEWNNIPQHATSRIITPMPNRLGEIRRARGGTTHH